MRDPFGGRRLGGARQRRVPRSQRRDLGHPAVLKFVLTHPCAMTLRKDGAPAVSGSQKLQGAKVEMTLPGRTVDIARPPTQLGAPIESGLLNVW